VLVRHGDELGGGVVVVHALVGVGLVDGRVSFLVIRVPALWMLVVILTAHC
jgi:hypothetical protein